MSFSTSGRGNVQATVTVTLDHPVSMASSTIGIVLGRFIAGDVPEEKLRVYKQWMNLLSEAMAHGELGISPDGRRQQLGIVKYTQGLNAGLEWDGFFMATERMVLRELCEQLANGQKTVVKHANPEPLQDWGRDRLNRS